MTVQELVQWCNDNGVSLDTHIAARAKDDYFITSESLSMDQAYFGNSNEGMDWERKVAPRIDGEIDWENIPKVLILETYSG